MIGISRSKTLSIPRQIGIYIAYTFGKFTQTEIGSYLNKDHTSISYVINTFSPKVDIDESLRKAIKEIESKLESNK